MSFASKYLKNWPLFVILIFILFRSIFFEGILSRSFNDFDEARYAEIAKNILKTNEWVVPLAGGPDEPRHIVYQVLDNGEILHPFFWKPPLHTVLIAIFYHIFGISE